jgi:TetR/AcrR family transcriptional regulator, tetracycline repressor protein
MTESRETSPEVFGTREGQHTPALIARRPLTRERILQTGLQLIDEQGLEAFTMRKLAKVLGVDPMSIYRHFENKDALLDGVADVLWSEVKLPESRVGWEALLRSFATSLRALAHVHPHAYALLCKNQSLSLALLRLCDVALEQLQQAGFEQKRAMEILCTVSSYAMGYAMVEVSALSPLTPEHGTPELTDIGRLTQLMRRLPRETPARLVEVACILTDCDMDAQFLFGLDLMLTSLKAQRPLREP